MTTLLPDADTGLRDPAEALAIEDRSPTAATLPSYHSTLHTPASALDQEPGALAAFGALMLVAGMVVAVFWGMRNPLGERLRTENQASALLADGRYSEAAQMLERALTRYDSPRVRLLLSEAYLARRDTERAERQANMALDLAPPDLKPAAWAQLGRVMAFAGRAGDARAAWDSVEASASPFRGIGPIEAQIRSVAWHKAMLAWSGSRFDDARARLETLTAGSDVYALSAHTKLAQLYAPTSSDISRKHLQIVAAELARTQRNGAGESGAAVPDLRVPGLGEGLAPQVMSDTLEGLNRAFTDVDKARKGGAGDAGIQALWGRAFLQQGEPYLARFYLEKAVAAQPDLADAHSYLALALLGTGDIAGALEHLRTAVRLAPDRPLPHYALASVYMAGKQWDQARGELSAIRQLEPDSVQLHIQLGEYYTRRGAYDNAEDEYITAMEKQRIADKVNPGGSAPGGLAAALALSRFYTDVRGSGCEKGLPAARIAQERNPRDPASLDAVGWSLVQCAKPTEALSSLENAVKSVPDSPRYHLHLGRAYALLSRTDDAREQLNRTVDLDPGGAWEEQAKAIIVGLK